MSEYVATPEVARILLPTVAQLATKVHQELGDVTGLLNFLRAQILE